MRSAFIEDNDRRPPTADRRPPTADRRPPTADRRPPTAERRTPNAERRTPNAERRTPNAERRTPRPALSLDSCPPDPRPRRRRSRLSLLLPTLALLLGALGLFVAAPAHAQTTVWSATLTVDEHSGLFGCNDESVDLDDCADAISPPDFTYNGATYHGSYIRWNSSNNTFRLELYKNDSFFSGDEHKEDLGSLILYVAETALPVSSATARGTSLEWTYDPATDWVDNQQVSLSLRATGEEGSRPKLTGLSLSAGGSAVTISCAQPENRVGCRATVPRDTTSVTVTPTWTGTASTATVSSRELKHDGNELTQRRASRPAAPST